MQFDEDRIVNPSAFEFDGRLTQVEIDDWTSRTGTFIPADLGAFWIGHGYGEFFQGEEILPPAPHLFFEFNVDNVTEWYVARGFPAGFVIFNLGLCLTAVNQETGQYSVFENYRADVGQARLTVEFQSLKGWYEDWIRPKYLPYLTGNPSTAPS